MPVVLLELPQGPITVYDFSVAGWQYSFAGWVLVHDAKSIP